MVSKVSCVNQGKYTQRDGAELALNRKEICGSQWMDQLQHQLSLWQLSSILLGTIRKGTGNKIGITVVPSNKFAT